MLFNKIHIIASFFYVAYGFISLICWMLFNSRCLHQIYYELVTKLFCNSIVFLVLSICIKILMSNSEVDELFSIALHNVAAFDIFAFLLIDKHIFNFKTLSFWNSSDTTWKLVFLNLDPPGIYRIEKYIHISSNTEIINSM